FPKGRAARVLWAGVMPPEKLIALAEQIERAVQRTGIAQEDRAFSPHVTLARMKTPKNIRGYLEAHASLASAPFVVEDFVLFQSELSSKGAKYTALTRFPLKSR